MAWRIPLVLLGVAFVVALTSGTLHALDLPKLAPRPEESPQPEEPEHPPAPQPRVDAPHDRQEDIPAQAPRPEPKPADNEKSSDDAGRNPALGQPNTVERDKDDAPAARQDIAKESTEPPPPTPPSPEEMACRGRLTALGVSFTEHPPISDPLGCSVPHPITLKNLGKDIALQPEAVLNCATAEAIVTFAQNTIAANAKSSFGSDLAAVNHASAYICRPRNGTEKLSEHAFGNAIDIASFTLSDKRIVDVEKTDDDTAANFLSAVRAAACGPFKTVLGPGNVDHDTHFHLDLAPRRNGATYCR